MAARYKGSVLNSARYKGLALNAARCEGSVPNAAGYEGSDWGLLRRGRVKGCRGFARSALGQPEWDLWCLNEVEAREEGSMDGS